MAFCKACGTELGGAAFCPKCGASQTASAVPMGTAPAATSEGLAENVAGLLCYVLGWLTGIIFILIDKRPFVRFHAAQSIVVFGALTLLRIAFLMMTATGLWGFWIFSAIISLVTLVMWILLMIKAYQHELFRVPIAAPIADGIAGKSI
jgi:uncharacterized membrane protein